MKKTYPTDLHQNQGQELSKKLYRSISELAKRLDDVRSCARTVSDLFTPNLHVQRKKFSEYCERLIFSDPVLYGKKGEELLWRKAYYEVISAAKKLKKVEYLPEDISNIQSHINAGIGFYHHFISKLQQEFNLDLNAGIDFSLINDFKKEFGSNSNSNSAEINGDNLKWAQNSVHQCLVYLGDLSRYKLEIYPNWEPNLAVRYYLQAVSYKKDRGMPHNQMGTLAMNRDNFLDAVYHYMRCLACKQPFEGTTNNLHGLFEKNSKYIEQLPDDSQNDSNVIIEPEKSENIKRFIARFLLLIDIWYFDKKVTKVYSLCHQTYKDLEHCLCYLKPTASESGDTATDSDSESQPSYLSGDALFKIAVVCLLCISKLKSSGSDKLSTVVAFTLAIYSQLLRNVTNRIREGVLNYPLTAEVGRKSKVNGILKDFMNGKKRKKSKLRRRIQGLKESDVESDASENENDSEDGDCSSSDDSFITDDNEEVVSESSDESSNETETRENKKKPVEPELEVLKKVQLMDVNDMLEIISEESCLQSVKVLNDWLKHDSEVLKSCAINTRSLIGQMVYLFNLVNINLTNTKVIGLNLKLSEIILKESKIPLPEDVVLKGIDVLDESQRSLDWDYSKRKAMGVKEETVVRIVKLISFGKFLTTVEVTGVDFDDVGNAFVCKLEETNEDLPVAVLEELDHGDEDGDEENGVAASARADGGGGQLSKMKHMGQLWLAAEVRALESRVGGKTSLSPYLVLDADALIKYTFMVKHLVHSRKFIVLVPTAVVSALDDLKKEKIEARDAIRWLESQFHRGNRFFRAQRQQERASVPFIKYPKKKDKEMHVYIQIVECCHYLAEQQKGASNVVTLLIGNQNVLANGENREFSYVGLAQSAGVAVESVTSFYGRWKKTKGKR